MKARPPPTLKCRRGKAFRNGPGDSNARPLAPEAKTALQGRLKPICVQPVCTLGEYGDIWSKLRLYAKVLSCLRTALSETRHISTNRQFRTENPRVGGSIPSLAIALSPPLDPPPVSNLCPFRPGSPGGVWILRTQAVSRSIGASRWRGRANAAPGPAWSALACC